ncbi:MAG: helix-turn-helix domain-containing protein [Candidatus Woesearchaeota archaeon]|nr:helix-turn-helix domain-containing protein [Candidatus Woesearchaeota archaeon]MDP7181877.1 helix-turn-helix domain-containing protein [Candidatus Woesearchaeota archaeon]MDP7467693.1 helix-turn-helix domain-containing protein [Candidatus Woesearchaeota archaeon]MDP7646777.1 helix-turn-helix domain-containing protein [Candidatus Woesearchaeota archaeon]
MIKTFKFRLYPTKHQEHKLLWTLDKCRFLYNELLSRLNNRGLSWNECAHAILDVKNRNTGF